MILLGGLGVMVSKVAVIVSMPRPHDVSRLRAFLGLANYYKKFAKMVMQLQKLLPC
jgi:hypothetical protein